MFPRFSLALCAIVLALASAQAVGKERLFTPVAGAGQEVRFSDGQAVLVTGNAVGNLAIGFVPLDKKSAFLRIWVENASNQQFNISETSLTASSAGVALMVYTYADQVKQQKRREMWAAIATGLAAGLNSYSASQAGYSNYSGSYRSQTNLGSLTANSYGSYYGTSYSSGVAYLAQANAANQNQAMFDRFQATAAGAAQNLRDRSLKANTLMPGQSVYGDIKVALPKASAGATMDIVINVGGQPLSLAFREGPLVVDNAPRPVSASVPAADLSDAPVQRGGMAAVTAPTRPMEPAALPPIRLSPPESSASALSHPSGPAARKELLKIGCTDNFNLVSSAAGKAVFEASCGVGGKRQLMECYGSGCRPLN